MEKNESKTGCWYNSDWLKFKNDMTNQPVFYLMEENETNDNHRDDLRWQPMRDDGNVGDDNDHNGEDDKKIESIYTRIRLRFGLVWFALSDFLMIVANISMPFHTIYLTVVHLLIDSLQNDKRA